MKKTLISLIFTFYLCSCAEVMPPVGQRFVKDNIIIKGRYVAGNKLFSDRVEFSVLVIDFKNLTTDEIPKIYLELENNKTYFLPDITIETLKSESTRIEKTDYPNCEGCPPDSTVYYIDWCVFTVHCDTILHCSCGHTLKAIWDESRTKRYQTPLSYEQVVEIFGPPDKLVDYKGL